MMNENEAVVEIFWIAFQSLSQNQKDQFYVKLLKDEEFLEDIDDILESYKRRNEPTRPIDDVIKELE